MQTPQDLFNFILNQDRCIVFGNLGRYPDRIFETLQSIPLLHVVIVSTCAFSSTENRIRVQKPTDPLERCDLLVYVEPASLQLVQKHPLASRVVVFTSHYRFKRSNGERWIHVSYFHGADPAGTKALIARQDFPIQTQNVGLVEIDHTNVLRISGRIAAAPKQANTFVIVDLTSFNRDVLTMYLAFWNAFDYLLEFRDQVDRWVVCFADNGLPAFQKFTQKVIDTLSCRNFEHGNVRDYREILALLPFFKSGTIDQKFEVKTFSFGGINFGVFKTTEDACKAIAMHDVIPISKNVLWIQN